MLSPDAGQADSSTFTIDEARIYKAQTQSVATNKPEIQYNQDTHHSLCVA